MGNSTRPRKLAAVVGGGVALGLLVAAMPGAPAQAIATSDCPTASWVPLTEAHEIINTATVSTHPKSALSTYKGAGTNPVSDDVWNATDSNGAYTYQPPSPYIRNTTRYLQFNMSKFIASPGMPVCETSYITTSDSYTWGAMSEAINAMWPYKRSDYASPSNINAFMAGNMVTTPGPGVVKVTANYKAQDMEFWANENGVAPGTPGAVPITRFFVKDRWGNEYVMHASAQTTPSTVQTAFNNAVLPHGWKKSARTMKKNLFLHPAEGSDGSFHYLVFRDSQDNTYHQIKWGNRGALQAQIPETGMPIWGGNDANVLRGNNRSNVMHGAGGADTLIPMKGDDEVWGDQGFDTVVLNGKASAWKLVALSRASKTLVIRNGKGETKTLKFVERLRLSNRSMRVTSLYRLGGRAVGQSL